MKKILIFILLCVLVGCTKKNYKILFETNGAEKVASITIPEDLKFQMPKNPTLEGHIFGGWYLDNNTFNYLFTINYLKENNIKNDIKLYAKWVVNIYKITFEENGGTDIEDTFEYFGSVINKPINPTKEGYRFVGWYIDKELTQEYTFSTMPSKNITLYAKWDGNYDITYNIIENQGLSSYVLLSDNEEITNVFFGSTHSSAISSLGNIYTWGSNRYGQLGDSSNTNNFVPTNIINNFNLIENESVNSISLGDDHSAALTSLGRVFTWGYNSYGQLGDGSLIDKNTPIDITNYFNLNKDEKIIKISLGYRRSTAITSLGRIFAWGYNNQGQLGDGSTDNKILPTDITSGFNLNDKEEVIDIILGFGHTAAITSSGRVFTWGINNYGQLGNNTAIIKNTPTDITNQFNLEYQEEIIDISLGSFHSSAVTSNGRIFTWGSNGYGQLGDNTTVAKGIPLDITNMFNLNDNEIIISVSLGLNHSGVVTSDGRIFIWGDNMLCQLGDETNKNKLIPTDITNKFNLMNGEAILNINLGSYCSSAITSSKRVFSWGNNSSGQLGDGTKEFRMVPAIIPFVYFKIMKIDTFEVGSTIDEFIPTLDNYTFDGWYLDKELTSKYIYGNMPSTDFNLYGKWSPLS